MLASAAELMRLLDSLGLACTLQDSHSWTHVVRVYLASTPNDYSVYFEWRDDKFIEVVAPERGTTQPLTREG